jgi:hypothetical protein
LNRLLLSISVTLPDQRISSRGTLSRRLGALPEIDIRRSDAMNACPPPLIEPTDVLNASPLPQLRRLVVTTTDEEIVISGRVPSYYLKQLAQEALKPALGERRLVNRVEVCPA